MYRKPVEASPAVLLESLANRLPLSSGFIRLVEHKPGLAGGDFATRSVGTENNIEESRTFDGHRMLLVI